MTTAPANLARLLAEVDADRMSGTVSALAGPVFTGRRAGSPGGREAHRWLGEQLRSLGALVDGVPFEVRAVPQIPSRVQLVELLARENRAMPVGEIVAAMGLAQSTVSQHLKILAEVRFVLAEPVGNARHYRTNTRCIDCFPSAADIVMGKPAPNSGDGCA